MPKMELLQATPIHRNLERSIPSTNSSSGLHASSSKMHVFGLAGLQVKCDRPESWGQQMTPDPSDNMALVYKGQWL